VIRSILFHRPLAPLILLDSAKEKREKCCSRTCLSVFFQFFVLDSTHSTLVFTLKEEKNDEETTILHPTSAIEMDMQV